MFEESYNKRGTCAGNQADMNIVYSFSERYMEAHRAIAKAKQAELVRPVKKLDHGQKHILTLIDRDKKEDGWSTVGKALFAHLKKEFPAELVEFRDNPEGGGFARLTELGNKIIVAMAWI